MQIRARWVWGVTVIVAAVAAAVPGCTNGVGGPSECPTPSGQDVACIWEGGVSFDIDDVVQKDGMVYVTGEMTWGPCGYNPGVQIRTYRIDPADGATARMDAPAGAETVPTAGSEPIEVVPAGATRRVRLFRDPMESVTEAELTIGELVDDATGEAVAEINAASVCDE
jgi:hypothetical protein